MAQWVDVCEFAALGDPGSHGFAVGEGDWSLQGFIVRQGSAVFAYENRCPHAGHPLNWVAHRFLDLDRRLIQCASHGALFALDTGVCVGGPCPGARLKSLPAKVTAQGMVQVEVTHWRWD